MKFIDYIFSNKNVLAWVLLIFSLALHVLDEALSGFLPFYNETVINIRAKTGFFPAPNFSFEMWIGGLAAAILICFSLTPLVAYGGKKIKIFIMIFGILMVTNALIHITGSVYSGEVLPGMWSSPFLLGAAIFVVYRAVKGEWVSNR
ncbi:hypothetical protein ACFL4T_09605 [candidate division KSB1 bacterium]